MFYPNTITRSSLMQVRFLVFNVPKGISNVFEASTCVYPLKYKRSIILIHAGFSASTNFFIPMALVILFKLSEDANISTKFVVLRFFREFLYALERVSSMAVFRAMFKSHVKKRPYIYRIGSCVVPYFNENILQ